MTKLKDLEAKYEPDDKIAIHEFAVRQLTQRIANHATGIAELVKNSCDAYSEADISMENKVIIVFLKNTENGRPALVGCLDFVGMTTEKIETRFKEWGSPEAALGGRAGRRKGGHGHGGKAYMVNMFKDHALLITCAGGFGNRYGFVGGEVRPGYFPDRLLGRRFPVLDRETLLDQNLIPYGVRIKNLPPDAVNVLQKATGFTLVKGVDPRDVPSGRFRVSTLIEELQGHPQMIEALQEAKVYLLCDSVPCEQAWPLKLETIEPIDEAKEPRSFDVPKEIPLPPTNEKICTLSAPEDEPGRLILRTSKRSMMWTYRPRHRIYIRARDEYIGSWDVRDLAGKGFADQIYGDLYLDSLLQYKTSDRIEPSDSSLTQAIKEWTRLAIEKYCEEFAKLEKLKATQKDRDEWQQVSEHMNEWKNKFLESAGMGLGDRARGEGGVRPTGPRLPRGEVASIRVSLSHELAGVGVGIQPTIEFRNAAGQRVRLTPYRWNSSDWNVAIVDEDFFQVRTFSPGKTEIWAETLNNKLISNKVCLTVLDIKNLQMKEESIELSTGEFRALGTVAEDRDGEKHEGVYLNWIVTDNKDIVRVGSAGVIWAQVPGTTEVTAGDDRALASPGTKIKVIDGVGAGKKKGKGYPQILLSGIDPDPFEPEKAPEQFLTKHHPPVSQRVAPDDITSMIFWVNMAAPLGNRYWSEATSQALTSDKQKQWRVYYLERFIEAMVKIRLFIDTRLEGNTSWDMLKERWDDVMIEMQEAMASELEGFLDSGTLPTMSK